jgi:formylglycine-generating enzyme required for sulfatase activity
MIPRPSAQVMNRLIPWVLASACLGMAPPEDDPLELRDVHGNLFPTKEQQKANVSATASQPSDPRRASCREGMVYIDEGKFGPKPVHGFCLDATEVTVADFAAYVEALEAAGTRSQREIKALKSALATVSQDEDPGADRAGPPRCTWPTRGQFLRYPINCVSVAEAQAYCRFHRKSLPTRREWQWAARGGKQKLKYPWGGGLPSLHAQVAAGPDDPHARPQPVGQLGPHSFGAFDLGGNVSEWTALPGTLTRAAPTAAGTSATTTR